MPRQQRGLRVSAERLIRDYAAFAGETPVSLLAAEGELSAYFTAPQRLAALFADRL